MPALICSILTPLPLVALIFTLINNVALAEDYYKWIDDKGVTHYSEKAPKNTATVKGSTQTGHSAPITYNSAKTEDGPKVSAGKSQALKDSARCKTAKGNLESIRKSSRIKIKGDNGEFRYLSQDEIAKRRKEASKVVKNNC
jgi:hypothetical protein|tara:strand:- start:1130 stop:1555 length:426 start_codon:yes stop_codon:yes gene_type:complete